jgi:hypothetical protein
MSVLACITAWLPAMVHAHMPGSERWWGVLLMAGAPVAALAPIFRWCLHNNVNHIGEQAQRAGGQHSTWFAGLLPRVGPGEERHAARNVLPTGTGPATPLQWLGDLRIHIRHQNVIALVLAAVSVAGLVGLVQDVIKPRGGDG